MMSTGEASDVERQAMAEASGTENENGTEAKTNNGVVTNPNNDIANEREAHTPGPSKQDRWAEIRKRAHDRANLRASENKSENGLPFEGPVMDDPLEAILLQRQILELELEERQLQSSQTSHPQIPMKNEEQPALNQTTREKPIFETFSRPKNPPHDLRQEASESGLEARKGKERLVDTSCAECQSKKIKCNGSKPCKGCLAAGSECIYSVLRDRRDLHDSIPEKTSDHVVPTATPELPSKQDRWEEIRKKAQDRAALLAKEGESSIRSEDRPQTRQQEAGDRNPEIKNGNEESSDEESIEARVARIKARVAELTSDMPERVEQQGSAPQNEKNDLVSHNQNAAREDQNDSGEEPIEARVERIKVRVAELTGNEEVDSDSRVDFRVDGIQKKNARFDIPAERNLTNIDQLISQATDEQEIKQLKQQKRLLRNRQAALDSRYRKMEDMAKVPHLGANDILESSAPENVATHLDEGSNVPLASSPLGFPLQSVYNNNDLRDLSLSPDPDAQIDQEPEHEAVYNTSRPQSQYPTPVVGDEDTLSRGDYPDEGFGYTNPRDLVQYDLNHTPQFRERRYSFKGDRTQRRRSADPTERGPPPTTRGFDKILRNEKRNLGDRNQNTIKEGAESSGEETIDSRVSSKVRVPGLTGNKNENTPSWADFISKRLASPTHNKLGQIDPPKKDISVGVGSSGHSGTKPKPPQPESSGWGSSFPELGFEDASTGSSSGSSDVRLESNEPDDSSRVLDHKKEYFDHELNHAKEENNKLGTRLADKREGLAEKQREPKGVLSTPKAKFTEDPNPMRERVAPLKGSKKRDIPPAARWTKISRKLVNPEALERGKERYEARDEFVIVLRVLSRDEVQDYAEATEKIRAARRENENRNDGRAHKKPSKRSGLGATNEVQPTHTSKTDPPKISSLSNNFEQLSREFERERQEVHGKHAVESPTMTTLRLQSDLTNLEKQFHRLDHTETQSQRTEAHKEVISGKIRYKLSQYYDALALLASNRSLPPANTNDVTSHPDYPRNSASMESPTQPSTPASTKHRLGREEVDTLEQEFKTNPKPTTQQKLAFSTAMNVDLARINNWFQNRRAKARQEKKQAAYEAGDETGYEAEREAWGPYQRPESPEALANDGYLGHNTQGHAKHQQARDIDPSFQTSDSEDEHSFHRNFDGSYDSQIYYGSKDERSRLRLKDCGPSTSEQFDIETSNTPTAFNNSDALPTTRHQPSKPHGNSEAYNDIATDIERLGIETANNARRRASYYGQPTAQSGHTAFTESSGYEDKICEAESNPTELSPSTLGKKNEVDHLASSEVPYSVNLAKIFPKTELRFTPEDDAQRVDLKEKKDLSWKENEEFFDWPAETLYSTNIEGKIPKRPWSLNDDRELARLVIEHGPRWNFVSRELGKRSPEDCEQRYFDLYRPKGELRDDESSILESSMSHKYGLRAEEKMNQDFHDSNFHKPSRYRCQICTYDSRYESSCKNHMKQVHGLDNPLNDNNRGQSEECPAVDDWRGWGNASKKEKKGKDGKSIEEPVREQKYPVILKGSSLDAQDRVSGAAGGASNATVDVGVEAKFLIAGQDVTQSMATHDTTHREEFRGIKESLYSIAATMQANAHAERSILTSYTEDDKLVWKEFRRELIKEGFSSSSVRKHKAKIKKYVTELYQSGVLDDPIEEYLTRSFVPDSFDLGLSSNIHDYAITDDGASEKADEAWKAWGQERLSSPTGRNHEENKPNDAELCKSGVLDDTIEEKDLPRSPVSGASNLGESSKTNDYAREDDDMSLASSTHDTMSIVSIDSVFSLLSGITGSSASSLQSSQDVIERLVLLFLEDETIRPACSKALETISRERFERNLRRLLKSFAVALRQEAESEDQRDTARFVLHRATNSAHLICNKLQRSHTPKKPIIVEDDIDEPLEESESDRSENFDSLQHLEAFIKESNAMDVLRKSLVEFVEQNSSTNAINNAESCSAEDPAENDWANFDDVIPSVDGETKTEQNAKVMGTGISNEDSKWSALSYLPVFTAMRAASVNLPLDFIKTNRIFDSGDTRVLSNQGSIHEITDLKYMKSLNSLLVKLGLIRPPVEPGKKRIEWRCKCGHNIYDDFTETKSGAAERFQLERITKNNQSSFNPSKSTSATLLSGIIANIRAIIGQANEKPCATLPMHERGNNCPTSSTVNTPNPQPQPPKDSLYLLLCYSEGRYATRLLQVDLTSKGAGCDKALFKLLRSNYQSMRGRFMFYLSFRILISIKFVSFELYRSQLVDVRKQDDIPPPEHTDYRYQPAPPELIPPIGERHMMHLFSHPDHAEDEPICLDRFPKKLKEKLLCRGGSNPGWGLQFVEGWDMRKIWGLVFLLFGMGSLLIGVLWSVYGHSIQDAFTMAGYMVAMAAVSMGTIQAFLVS